MVECPECGEEDQKLGLHWYYSPSHRPELTQKQLEITTGLLMGDGSISKQSKNCYLQLQMISPKYLEYLDNIFACLGTGVSLVETAYESAKNDRDGKFSPNIKEENYSDVYGWGTRSHPKFNEFREWYETGEKIWPEDIELTPTVLKHWYVGDGHYDNHSTHNRIIITMSNEVVFILGSEKDEDLVLLCSNCHRYLERLYKIVNGKQSKPNEWYPVFEVILKSFFRNREQ